MTLPFETARFEALKKLAGDRFGEMTAAEEEVLRLSSSSEINFQPQNPDERPEIRAELVRWLATELACRDHIDPRGLRVCCSTVSGELNLSNCRMPFPLDFRMCTFQGVLSLVSAGAQQFTLIGCSVPQGIKADGLTLEGSLFLRCIESSSEIRLPAARIHGNAEFQGARIVADGVSLNLEGAEIQGSIFLKPYPMIQPPRTFLSTGCMRLTGAKVYGDLDCTGASFCIQGAGSSAYALNLDRAYIAGSIRFGAKFRATRDVSAIGARIGESLECCGAHLAESGRALTLNRTKIGGSIVFGINFKAAGDLNLGYAEIASDFNCDGANLGTVNCEDMKVSGSMIWTSITDATSVGRYLNISGANVKNFIDDEASWPTKTKLIVDGLIYRDIELRESRTAGHEDPARLPPKVVSDLKKRISWLKLQGFKDQLEPQPWMQLANVLKEKGQDGDARWVLLNFRLRQASAGKWFLWPIRVPLALFSWEPLLVLLPFALILLLGHQTYQKAWDQHQIVPTASDTFIQKAAGASPAQAEVFAHAYPVFNPWVYTLENELPLVKFGMDDKWAPDPNLANQGQAKTYWWLAGFRWFLIVAGWAQGILLTFGINRRLHD